MRKFLIITILMVAAPIRAGALPFNDEMVDVQMRAGSIMKAKPADSVPFGSLHDRLETREEAHNWINPRAGDAASLANGKRLFFTNCYTCHGDISKNPVTPGPAGAKFAFKKPPDISSGDFKNRTDGDIYATMYLGFGLMPRLGWKLSPTEKWDIVTYVRKIQASK